QHTIFIIDRNDSALQVTTNAVTVQPVWLYAVITPTVSFAGEQSLTLTVEARDINDDLVPSYRGALNINPSTSTSGLPQSPNNFLADYTFTEADAGRHVFPNFSFNGDGQQTITV